MSKIKKIIIISFLFLLIALILILSVRFYYGADNVVESEINQSVYENQEEIKCKTICGGLCYNQDYVICVDDVAQVKTFRKEGVWISEINQPKFYLKDSNMTREFLIHNDLGRDVNVLIYIEFMPVATISFGQTSSGKSRTLFTDYSVSLKKGEVKILNISIPKSGYTLSSNIILSPRDADNPTGVGSRYYSSPFSIYDSNMRTKNCNGYIYNPWSQISDLIMQPALCLDNLFIPLGSIGCESDNDCGNKKCVQNHCFPSNSRDRNPENVSLLMATIYIDDNESLIADFEQGIQDQLNSLSLKFEDIKNQIGNPKDLEMIKKRCNVKSNEVMSLINEMDSGDSYNKKVDEILSLCKINKNGYTHIYVIFPQNTETNLDDLIIVRKNLMDGIIAHGLYVGNGILLGTPHYCTLNGSEYCMPYWTIMLHEITHSFGAPDLYLKNDINGVNYLWGDCRLMKAESFNINTSLCTLEYSYYESYSES